MKNCLIPVFIWIFTLLPTGILAAEDQRTSSKHTCDPLCAYQATYQVQDADGDKIGTVNRALRPMAENGSTTWTLSIQSKAKKLFFVDKRQEISTFVVAQGSLKPLRYRYHVDNSFREKLTEETFDWSTGFVSGHRDKDRIWRFAVQPGLTDPLSGQWVLRQHLARGTSVPGVIEIPVSHKGSVTVRAYRLLKTTPCPSKVAQGQTCVLVERVNGKRTTRFFMAQELCYLPVLIEQYKNGKLQATAVLTSYRQEDARSLKSGEA